MDDIDASDTASQVGDAGDGLLGDDGHFEKRMNKLLNSSLAKDKISALRRLIVNMMEGQDMSKFFAEVVKNTISPSFEVKKLVFAYLVRYAEDKPEIALMAINSIQKGLEDPNPVIRAMSLRAMSSIRVKMIVPLIVLAIRRTVGDSSAYVRKVAALAIPKVFALDAERKDELVEVIVQLLRDKSTVVLGAAVYAFDQICPDNWEILHQHFRKLCQVLVDCDEWSQVVIINCLTRYGRLHFAAPYGFKDHDDVDDLGISAASTTGSKVSSGLSLSILKADEAAPGTPYHISSETHHVDEDDTIPRSYERKTIQEELEDFYSDDENDKSKGDKKKGENKPHIRVVKDSDSEEDSSDSDSDSEDDDEEEGEDEEIIEEIIEEIEENDTFDLLAPSQKVTKTRIVRRIVKKKSEKKEKRSTKSKEEKAAMRKALAAGMDSDLRMLLKGTEALFQSRNSAVVVAVASLYYHIAPRGETVKAAKSLVRLIRSSREIAAIVLSNIVQMTSSRPSMFSVYLKEFWVTASDPNLVRLQKLEILTHIANEANISSILREFKTAYLPHYDKEFASAAVQAIGKCAIRLPVIADRCLLTLMDQLTSSSQELVSEAVVVIRRLLQILPDENAPVIGRLAKLLDRGKIAAPMARASIIWVIGEYADKIPQIAPDVLRKCAKGFMDEENIVKLQIMTLAVKLKLRYPETTSLLFVYVMDLCKYDMDYDIRDRSRMLRNLTVEADRLTAGTSEEMAQKGIDVLLKEKPAPSLDGMKSSSSSSSSSPNSSSSSFGFAVGTISQYVDHIVAGYAPIPAFVTESTPSTLRDPRPEIEVSTGRSGAVDEFHRRKAKSSSSKKKRTDEDGFYIDGSDDESSSGSGSYSGSDDESGSGSSYSGSSYSGSSYSGSGSESEGSEYSSSSSDSESENVAERKSTKKNKKNQKKMKTGSLINLNEFESLDTPPSSSRNTGGEYSQIGVDDVGISTLAISSPSPTTTTTGGGGGNYTTNTSPSSVSSMANMSSRLRNKVLLTRESSGGSIECSAAVSRFPSLAKGEMISVHLVFTNCGSSSISCISMEDVGMSDSSEMEVVPFHEIVNPLEPGRSFETNFSVLFTGRNQFVKFALCVNSQSFPIKFAPTLGEIIRPPQQNWDEDSFDIEAGKLSGLNTSVCKLSGTREMSMDSIYDKVVQQANVVVLTSLLESSSSSSSETIKCVASPVFDPSVVLFCTLSSTEVCVASDDSMFGPQFCDFLKLCIQ